MSGHKRRASGASAIRKGLAMDSRQKKTIGIVGAVAALSAAGFGAAVGIQKFAVGRSRFHPDPDADEPFGKLRGEPLTVLADDGLPLQVEIHGSADAPLTMVLCHGYCLTQDSWHYQRRDLTGLRMVSWDQRSHGRSGRSTRPHATIEQTGRDLATVLRATVRPGDPVILAGHSMGGMTIMALADQQPELFGTQIVGVALVNTSSGDLDEMTLGLPPVLARLVRPLASSVIRGLGRGAKIVDRTRDATPDVAFWVIRRMGFSDRHVSPAMVDFVEQMIRATPIEVVAEFYPTLMEHHRGESLEVLGRVPTVILSGGHDRLTPAAHSRVLAEALPDAELVEVADAGHLLPMEYPGIVTAAIRRLIARVHADRRERSA
ncbi:MAG: alpha/beta hydrolase fold protein [Actinomycetia bacterium]|nr:alpha/beta hydrolase fold protein [Actinomycetes bacterium]